VVLYGPTPSFTFDNVGIYNVTLNVSDSEGNWALDWIVVTVRDITQPIADAGPDIEIDQFSKVDFDGSKSSDNVGIVSWSWTFLYDGSNNELTGANPYFYFDIPGTYTIYLRVTDEQGNSGDDELKIVVRDIVAPVPVTSPDQEVDQDELVTLDGSASTDNVGIVSWFFNFTYDYEFISLNGPVAYFTFTYAGVYLIQYEVVDAAGNHASSIFNVTVLDITPPVADAGSDQEADQHQPVIFDGTASYDNIGVVNWTWSVDIEGVPVILSGAMATYAFTDVGEYVVTMTAADEEGNSAFDIITITVKDVTKPRADAGANQTVEQGEKVTFAGADSTDNVGVINWSWSFYYQNKRVWLYGSLQTFIFNEPGNYTITLTASDIADNSGKDTIFIQVLPKIEDKDGDDQNGDSANQKKDKSDDNSTMLLVIAAVIIIIILAFVFLFIKNKKSKERQVLEPSVDSSAMPPGTFIAKPGVIVAPTINLEQAGPLPDQPGQVPQPAAVQTQAIPASTTTVTAIPVPQREPQPEPVQPQHQYIQRPSPVPQPVTPTQPQLPPVQQQPSTVQQPAQQTAVQPQQSPQPWAPQPQPQVQPPQQRRPPQQTQ
jgi:PKD repeat protein